MCHIDLNGVSNNGEIYSFEYAKKVVDTYQPNANVNDMYVALNSTYHDFANLLKKWFNEVKDERVVQICLQFWFLDEDYENQEEKVWLYFN